MLLIQWWAGCEKLQMLFLFSCNVIGFFKQALWKFMYGTILDENSWKLRIEFPIRHFTVVYLDAKSLIWSEAEGDHVVIETNI